MEKLLIKRVREGAVLPRRATEGSAGYDICACLDEPLLLPARGRVLVPTGLAIAVQDPHFAAFIFARSGLGVKHGIAPSNGVGVIDSDYRGEFMVGLTNHSDRDYLIEPGERVAQMLFLPVALPLLVECGELPETARGGGGFGSTGRETIT